MGQTEAAPSHLLHARRRDNDRRRATTKPPRDVFAGIGEWLAAYRKRFADGAS